MFAMTATVALYVLLAVVAFVGISLLLIAEREYKRQIKQSRLEQERIDRGHY